MAETTSPAGQRAVPMLSYEDVAAAVDWLVRVFGFREAGERFADPDGRVTHAEVELDGARVMLGWPGPDYQSPERHAAVCEYARRWLDVPYVVDGVLVYVDDVDRHVERARAGGARILREPTDQPYGRLYTAADPEGHRWMFLQPPSS
ncbi:MAG TPA: VOC family protein [Candidatus Limnocylindrales bacterium]|nr:VOC family protein [Candidatus Limnocylindrales bacterium]